MTASPRSSTPGAMPATVAWLVERANLSKDAQPLAAGAADGGVLVQRLIDGGHAAEAVRVVAFALPPREGVWWAWISARHAAQLEGEKGGSAPAVTEALSAVEQWVAKPEDGERRASWAASGRAGLDTPAGCAAAAPFFVSGSVAPPEIAEVPPPAGLHSVLIGTAVTLAAVADPAHFDALVSAYVAQGLEVVKQLGGWDKSVETARLHFDAQRERHEKALQPPAKAATPEATKR